MIYDEFEVTPLEAVKYEQAQITVRESPKALKKIKKERVQRPPRGNSSNGGIIDMLIKQCFICVIVLLLFAGINFVGLDSFIDNLKQVAEASSITDIFNNANFI